MASNLRRSTRGKKVNLNYKDFNNRGFEDCEEELNYQDDQLELETNPSSEKLLCGSDYDTDHDESEQDSDEREDGQISDSEESAEEDGMDEEVKTCVRDGNLEKLKKILKAREEENNKLKKDLLKKKEKEKRRNKEMQAVLHKLHMANKTRSDLRRSITNSRNASPATSPKLKRSKHSNSKADQRVVIQKGGNKTKQRAQGEMEQRKCSEYDDTFKSFLKLKNGNDDKYSELVLNAMEATDNIMSLKHSREDKVEESSSDVDNGRDKHSKVKIGNSKNKGHDIGSGKILNSLLNEVSAKQTKTNKCECEPVLEMLLAAAQALSLDNDMEKTEAITPEKTSALLSKLIGASKARGRQSAIDRIIEILQECDEGISERSETKEETKEERRKKLTSGRLTKPDESEIKMVVKFPHERLNPRHIKNREFDGLPFNLLIAGELELITSDIDQEECDARLAVAKTLCYHKNYLKDEDLRDGYNQKMKRVERRQQGWNEVLGEHLHEILDYRANLLVREKLNEAAESSNNSPFIKVDNRKGSEKRRETEAPGQVIYCQDFNSNRCYWQGDKVACL